VRSRVWRWADCFGLPLLAAAMDAAWIAPYALGLGAVWVRPGTALLGSFSLFALLAAAQMTARGLLARGAPGPGTRAVLILGGAVAAAAAVAWHYGTDPWWHTHGPLWHAVDAALRDVRPEIPAFVLGVLVWRRGIAIGRSTLEYYDIEGIFYLGLAAFGVLAAGVALGHSETTIAASALPYLIVFFAASLFALPLARLRSIRQRTQASGQAVALSNDWYALIAGGVAAVLGATVLAGALLRLDLAAVVRILGRLADPLLWILLYVIALPLGVIVTGIIWLIRLVLHPGGKQPLPPVGPPAWIAAVRHQGTAALPPAAAATLRWGVLGLVVVFLLLWLARSIFRYDRIGKFPPAEEVHESVWSWADLKAALAAWRKRSRWVEEPPAAPRYGSGAVAVVRRTYAELLGLAAALGRPRAPHQTPAEFAGSLGAAWPETSGDVGRLTEVYNRVRYGLAAPSDGDLAAVRTALEEIRRARHGRVA
jgi:hypothetical protein